MQQQQNVRVIQADLITRISLKLSKIGIQNLIETRKKLSWEVPKARGLIDKKGKSALSWLRGGEVTAPNKYSRGPEFESCLYFSNKEPHRYSY